MRRYAFIDVANTLNSATAAGFQIDPQRLFDYLVNRKWSCTEVFWYSGRLGDEQSETARVALEATGYTIRDKSTQFFDRTDRFHATCPNCDEPGDFVVTKPRRPKANCDVELAVDCLERARPDTELLIFSGDGDFRYLIEKVIEKGATVRLFSTDRKDRYGKHRFSTRLKALLKEHEGSGRLFFTDLATLMRYIGQNPPGPPKPRA